MMPLWTAEALRDATDGQLSQPFDATGISIDTRTLKQGDLFVALRGETDGHAHVADALRRGAAGAMVHDMTGLPKDAPLLLVADTLTGLHTLGAAARARFKGRAVAVTGSVGKTTTKEMLRTLLAAGGTVHAAEASYNNHWGVPLTLARMPAETDFLVSEIGMNHPGEIAPLARLVRPHVAVIVSVESAHIGHMGSLEAIADEKAAILTGLEPNGIAIMPGDHTLMPRLQRAARKDVRVMSFGASPARDATLIACEENEDLGLFRARILQTEGWFRLGLPGQHMAMNATAAMLAAAVLGVPPREDALASFQPVSGRGGRRPILHGRALLLDESYNASSASVRAALSVLRLHKAERRVAVLGDMRELGEFGPAEHAGLADAVARSVDLLHCCGPLMRHLYDAVPEALRGIHTDDAASLASLVADATKPGDAVLVKGSYGSRMRLVVQALETPMEAPPMDAQR